MRKWVFTGAKPGLFLGWEGGGTNIGLKKTVQEGNVRVKFLVYNSQCITPVLENNFTVLKKCNGKFDCILYEMLLIRKRKPNLNIQSDSIKAKVFVWIF